MSHVSHVPSVPSVPGVLFVPLREVSRGTPLRTVPWDVRAIRAAKQVTRPLGRGAQCSERIA
jgi:hypothetical protein